jgi:alcohol dehydrogenase class IV
MVMPAFEFATAGRIVFGSGSRHGLGELLGGHGRRPLVVRGASARHDAWLGPLLAAHGLAHESCAVAGEPTLDLVRAGVDSARQAGSDVILGLGGGSVLDAAKAIAALVPQPADVLEYLEVIGRGRPLEAPPLPCIAVPTTAGTGSEVTRNAVLGSPGDRVKASLRSPAMLPRVALVDPELTLSLPRDVTAATGLDALAQLVEPFVGFKASPLTDGVCREGLTRVSWALRAACTRPDDRAAREAMCVASLCGGLALANAGLGAVHGFAGPLGGMFDAPHGAVCAVLLPGVMAANLDGLRRRGDTAVVGRFREVAVLLTGHPDATPDDAVAWVAELVAELGVPPLSAYGMTTADIPEAVAKARRASSMRGNPVELADETLAGIVAQVLG